MTEPRRPSTRALLGTMMLIVFLLIYVLAAMLAAAAVLPRSNGLANFLFYAIAGLAWVPPAGLIIQWMYPRASVASRLN